MSSRLPELARPRRILELMGIAALPGTGTGHTGIAPFQRPLDWGMYPYYVWRFDDGAWITLAGAGAEEALGAELLAVGGRPVDELFDQVAPFLSADNEVGRKALEGASLSFEQMLQALGAAGEDGVAVLTLRRPGGEPFTLRVEPVQLASLGGLRWGRTLQSPVDTASPADPRPRTRPHRLEWRERQHLLYLQLDEVRDADDETLAALAERLLRMADEHDVGKLVIDLRADGGGNNQLIEPLVAAISGHPELDRRGVLYTLIGRRTFSAAGNLASALERRTKTRFAGEPSGFSPNQVGDVVRLALPRSKIIVRISTRLWADGGPYDRRRWIAPSSPELAPPVTYADHAAGRDPVLEAVLADRPEPRVAGALDPAAAAALAGRYRFGPFQELSIEPGPGGRLRLEIRGVRIFAASDLYPAPTDRGGPIRFATDLPRVTLALDPADGSVSLDWDGTMVPLPPSGSGSGSGVRAGSTAPVRARATTRWPRGGRRSISCGMDLRRPSRKGSPPSGRPPPAARSRTPGPSSSSTGSATSSSRRGAPTRRSSSSGSRPSSSLRSPTASTPWATPTVGRATWNGPPRPIASRSSATPPSPTPGGCSAS